MKLSELFANGKPTLSFEVFPPKTDAKFEEVMAATCAIADLKPAYMSVTYGAGGGTSEFTVAIAERIKHLGVTPLAHLTCISSTPQTVNSMLQKLSDAGIENILALRGDIPSDLAGSDAERYYTYASDLIGDIRAFCGDFCIGGACYPEGHVECESGIRDIEHLKLKVDAGCEFLTTQMFFDNNILYNFLYKIREAGITVPVVAGIMPITNASFMKRTLSLTGTELPRRFKQLLDRFGDNPAAMKQAGIAYATEQIFDLYANGINAVHVYSMNKPDVAAKIFDSLCDIV